jgi:hypothetical protein
MLTREQLLGSFQRRYRTVETPLGEVRIQNLNEGEKSLWQDANYDKDGRLVANWLSKSRRRLVAACLVDEAAIADACSDHIGLPLAEAKELEKNSDGAHADGSPTA